MRTLPIAFAAATIAITGLACGQDEEAAAPAPTTSPTPLTASSAPAVKGQLWRWANVAVVIPQGSAVVVVRGTIPSEMKGAGGPGLELVVNHDHGSVSNTGIDATTGDTVFDTVAAEDRTAIDEVLKTLAVGSYDDAYKGWPYEEHPTDGLERSDWGGVSYLIPDPSSGVQVSSWLGDPGGAFLNVSNGRSTILILQDAETGTLSQKTIELSPLDKAAFDRYFSSIQPRT